jgi:hypothetical protein
MCATGKRARMFGANDGSPVPGAKLYIPRHMARYDSVTIAGSVLFANPVPGLL